MTPVSDGPLGSSKTDQQLYCQLQLGPHIIINIWDNLCHIYIIVAAVQVAYSPHHVAYMWLYDAIL